MAIKKFILSSLAFIICISVNAQDAEIDFISDCLVTGAWADIEARDDYVFATNGYGLMVYRFNPDEGIDEPIEVARYPTSGNAAGLVIHDSLCYIADGSDGLLILSVADLNSIYEVGVCPGLRGPHIVRIIGNYAYTGAGHGGLMIASIEDPTNPEVLGGPLYGMVRDLEVFGDYVYVTLAATARLYIVCVENPANPEQANAIEFDTGVFDIELKADTLFISTIAADDSAYIFSLENPENPRLITGIANPPNGGISLKVSENTLFYTRRHMTAIDIRNIFGSSGY